MDGRAELFALKTYGAAVVALGIAFAADLDRPYWAMASAYIASQPQAGATRSKALYRLLGTLLGASGAVAMVPNLVTARPLLVLAMSGWVALMVALALLDRTPRSYVFTLAGFTAAIIGFPSVDAPDAVFSTAILRAEEIGLGVVCASVVHSLVFPSHVGPVLIARMTAWLEESERLAARALRGEPLSLESEAQRRRLAAAVVDIGVLTAQMPYDSGPEASLDGVRALHARLLMLLPLASSIAARRKALCAVGAAPQPSLEAAACNLAGAGTQTHSASRAQDWRGVLEASLDMRVRELATLIADARALLSSLRAGEREMPPLRGGVEIEAAPLQHRDPPMAIYSGASAGVAVALVCAYWIASAWPEGAIAAEMTAVACCFFAAQDDPAPAIFRFLRATVVALVIDAVYLFAVLPAIDGFVMLVVALAPPFLVYAWLAGRPATNPTGMALGANGATLLALQSAYSADFGSFANNAAATVVGLSAAAVATRLIRSVGADWSAWRLQRANWRSLSQAAKRRGVADRAAFAGLIADRIGLIAARAGAITAEQAPSMGRMQAELRVGLNIIDLRRARYGATPQAVATVDAVLERLSAYYRELAGASLRVAPREPSPEGLARIDAAIREVAALAGAAEETALQGLVGLRLALYPTAPPFEGGAAPDPIPQRTAA